MYVVLRTTGDVVGGACNFVARKGEACSHVALSFYLEGLNLKDISTLPGDDEKTVTDQPHQWHKLLKCGPKQVSSIHLASHSS